MCNYNTTRPALRLREYGRNIQTLIQQLADIQDKALRTQKTYAIVKLMEIINHNAESAQKRWDAVFMLADYQLDIDIDCKPEKKVTMSKDYVEMPRMRPILYKYYGRNIELLIRQAAQLQSVAEQEIMLKSIIKLMRRFSSTWNNENINHEKILEDIKSMLPDGAVLDESIIRSCLDSMAYNQRSKPYQQSRNLIDKQ